jgi:tetratricopeptide (TPR) repeat protein
MENFSQQFEPLENSARTRSISSLLDQVEARLGKMAAGTSDHGLAVLIELDEVYYRFSNYSGSDESIKSEKAQYEYVHATIRSNMGMLLKKIGGAERLAAMRAQRKPRPDQWWWFLDERVAEQRRVMLRRSVTIMSAVVVVTALLVVVYQMFLAPSPETIARMQHQRMAEVALMEGDIDAALVEIENALSFDPGNRELLVMQAIGQQLIGQEQIAEVSFARLERIFGDREEYLLQRALHYNQFGRPDLSLADAQTVLAANPESAVGVYYAGIASENLGDYFEAMQYYELAYDLAIEQDMTALAATIRMNMGMLMQALPGLLTSEMGE